MQPKPLVVHVIHHLIMGGLETGLINLINRMPRDKYSHVIICMDGYSSFREGLSDRETKIYAMHRKPGRDPGAFWRLCRLLRELKPTIVHSRNLSGLNALLPAFIARVPHRIHGEHGWYDDDSDGSNRKYQIIRKVHRPLVSHYVALSKQLQDYLQSRIGVHPSRIRQIYNGVDTEIFHPIVGPRPSLPRDSLIDTSNRIVVGSVGRFQKIKNSMNLAVAFAHLIKRNPNLRNILCLAMIGDGGELAPVRQYIKDSAIDDICWLPGARRDISDLMRCMDLFVLPSRGEGISNTILEAMATGLPVIATQVGGNGELVHDGVTGTTVPSADSDRLAFEILRYVSDEKLRRQSGSAGRSRAIERFSIQTMTNEYTRLYDDLTAPYQHTP